MPAPKINRGKQPKIDRITRVQKQQRRRATAQRQQQRADAASAADADQMQDGDEPRYSESDLANAVQERLLHKVIAKQTRTNPNTNTTISGKKKRLLMKEIRRAHKESGAAGPAVNPQDVVVAMEVQRPARGKGASDVAPMQ
ncbi:hypothetical protein CAOG_01186 [Capsaspora owczarzaki ATCC 30864]|uniref:Uncharacterized protein n=1 Tax=Capsaspora owczarzaki (strain ATCC 30864) TaxID=595528 RepID=A0A0D2VIF2_CAPO3|nr:hypothetical protein CAOG_01186 [Capsaspora owczarzaki ATCC 30864]KJE89757.1 hypothetical protein CAOG_001186 [Capsaspora owczarzaki ATCC 30864]|eukprot:XP_004366057.1 hypothetical protein CAOG_01186 [Capsaspora owczarzaki ATCC 30864]